MEESILKSTKEVLGRPASDLSFDLEIITHINASFGTLYQLGLGPVDGYHIEDDTAVWADTGISEPLLHMTKAFIFLNTQMLYDPPATSFFIEARNKQLDELVWRLNTFREVETYVPPVDPELVPELYPPEF